MVHLKTNYVNRVEMLVRAGKDVKMLPLLAYWLILLTF